MTALPEEFDDQLDPDLDDQLDDDAEYLSFEL